MTLTGRGGITIDQRCQAGPGLWAAGDVTGIALFTHVATYQGRIVADNILGRDRTAAYEGIPRVVFADPEIAAVGLTAAQAAARGIATAAAEISVPDAIARPWTYERDPRGTVGVLADRDRGVLAGAWAVAPLASEWIHYAALAIRAQIPVTVLLDQVAQFPTYTEACPAALPSTASTSISPCAAACPDRASRSSRRGRDCRTRLPGAARPRRCPARPPGSALADRSPCLLPSPRVYRNLLAPASGPTPNLPLHGKVKSPSTDCQSIPVAVNLDRRSHRRIARPMV